MYAFSTYFNTTLIASFLTWLTIGHITLNFVAESKYYESFSGLHLFSRRWQGKGIKNAPHACKRIGNRNRPGSSPAKGAAAAAHV